MFRQKAAEGLSVCAVALGAGARERTQAVVPQGEFPRAQGPSCPRPEHWPWHRGRGMDSDKIQPSVQTPGPCGGEGMGVGFSLRLLPGPRKGAGQLIPHLPQDGPHLHHPRKNPLGFASIRPFHRCGNCRPESRGIRAQAAREEAELGNLNLPCGEKSLRCALICLLSPETPGSAQHGLQRGLGGAGAGAESCSYRGHLSCQPQGSEARELPGSPERRFRKPYEGIDAVSGLELRSGAKSGTKRPGRRRRRSRGHGRARRGVGLSPHLRGTLVPPLDPG